MKVPDVKISGLQMKSRRLSCGVSAFSPSRPPSSTHLTSVFSLRKLVYYEDITANLLKGFDVSFRSTILLLFYLTSLVLRTMFAYLTLCLLLARTVYGVSHVTTTKSSLDTRHISVNASSVVGKFRNLQGKNKGSRASARRSN